MAVNLFRAIAGKRSPMFCRIIEGHLTSYNQFITKLYSNKKEDEEELETFKGPIPRDKLDITFSRSSGPGGQNVNKLSTKAEIRFNVQEATWLPDRVKVRVQQMFKNRVNKSGELIVTSQVYRTQHQNLEDSIKKLNEILLEASELPNQPSEAKLARIRKLKSQYNAKRLREKKYNSFLKRSKKIIDD